MVKKFDGANKVVKSLTEISRGQKVICWSVLTDFMSPQLSRQPDCLIQTSGNPERDCSSIISTDKCSPLLMRGKGSDGAAHFALFPHHLFFISPQKCFISPNNLLYFPNKLLHFPTVCCIYPGIVVSRCQQQFSKCFHFSHFWG